MIEGSLKANKELLPMFFKNIAICKFNYKKNDKCWGREGCIGDPQKHRRNGQLIFSYKAGNKLLKYYLVHKR